MARGNKNGTVLDLIVICEISAPLNIQIKLTKFVKLLNCGSLKSRKNGLSSQWEH